MCGKLYVGIDLTAKEEKPTIISILFKRFIYFKKLFSTREIIEFIQALNPDVIAIDAPFQLPKTGWFRDCDILMKHMGLKPLPPTWSSMRKLTLRAIEIISNLKKFKVIETFPSGALSIIGVRNLKSKKLQFKIFSAILSVEKLVVVTKFYFRKDFLDSLLASLAAKYFNEDLSRCLIFRGEECEVVIPKIYGIPSNL